MKLDADEFLGGGSALRLKFAFGELTLELDGTVMRGGVAFYIIHGVGQNKGAMVSGPMLRIRNLSADEFRHFLVEHLSQHATTSAAPESPSGTYFDLLSQRADAKRQRKESDSSELQ